MATGGLKPRDPKWGHFLCKERIRDSKVKGRSDYDARTPFGNDYDRVIFSSSFRRLKDKAQVFSLESHDFVRTRLAHSIEASTIGRALGEGVAKHLNLDGRDAGDLVATVCLIHDLGNPPFGHSGERAIGAWFNGDAKKWLSLEDEQELADLTGFEGNAQALRIVTRTQWSGDDYGMNLTTATLSALVKYPCSSIESKGRGGLKALAKFGYFKADKATFDDVRRRTGLKGHMRHPLTFLMEAADDIAYAAADLEDVFKKGLVGYDNIRGILNQHADETAAQMIKMYLDGAFDQLSRVEENRERQQLALQRFSQMAVRKMTQSAIECFVENAEAIVNGDFDSAIVETMKLSRLCIALKAVMEDAVYSHLESLAANKPLAK
jgi:dGTPase